MKGHMTMHALTLEEYFVKYVCGNDDDDHNNDNDNDDDDEDSKQARGQVGQQFLIAFETLTPLFCGYLKYVWQ